MNMIAAVDQNWAIGKDGDQLVYIPEDLKRFKALTTGHPVILGRKTLATFPGGRPLKGRRNLILSQSAGFAPEGAEVFRDLSALLAAAPEDSFVIGGASVYAALLGYLLLDEKLSVSTAMGALLITAGGLWAFLYNRKKAGEAEEGGL